MQPKIFLYFAQAKKESWFMEQKIIKTDVVVMGAGPAGCATALKLDRLGIPCLLVEKSQFPRDKTCGDAISSKVTVNLKRIDPDLLKRFYAAPWKMDINGIRVALPSKGKNIDLAFKPSTHFGDKIPPSFTARRMDFDNFLAEEVKNSPLVDFRENTNITDFARIDGGFELLAPKQGLTIQARMVVDATGAQSKFSRQIAKIEKEEAHFAGSVRAYFKNVTGFKDAQFIEIHYLKSITPGYFWIFPLPGNAANVGIGMRTDFIKDRNVNLRKEIDNIIQNHPGIKERFAQAEQEGPWKGFGLPMGSKRYPLTGDHFILTGDAGHLIDPLSGEGIGHAFYSGVFAAEQIEQCLAANDFSAHFLKDYDARIWRVIGKEMKLSYRMQKILNRPFLVAIVAKLLISNQKLISKIADMFTDFELRKQLVKPGFWIRNLFRIKG